MYKRIVVKFGTSVLTGGTPRLNLPHMVDLVRQCAAIKDMGKDIIICTSGAIAVGQERLDFPQLSPTLSNKQMLAAVGQSRLMQMWERFFEIYGTHVGQILLTRSDVENRGRFLNARDTLNALLDHDIVPVVNENDAVTTAEIKVGDNDNLSALVTILADADLLLLLTDQPGLFTADPRKNPNAKLIPEVNTIDETLQKLAGGSGSGLGVGGMATKLEAADAARRAGADVVIASGHAPDVIIRAVEGEPIGTRFPALEVPLVNRKRWIFAAPKVAGSLTVDNGAAHALCNNDRSLLPAGILEVEGSFARGDTITIKNSAGKVLARGITRYTAGDLRKIAGSRSDEIESRLGYVYGSVAVHRDDLILM